MATNESSGFVFYSDDPQVNKEKDLVAAVPASICDAKTLLNVIFEELRLPGYFGFNWNALSDCLRDLSWTKQYRVMILHHDLPHLVNEELFAYLSVLQECVTSWKPGEEHELIAAFPKDVEAVTLGILRNEEGEGG